jgi:ABC-type cobalamin/Fe3+-siderophores transport system ATPase subunit
MSDKVKNYYELLSKDLKQERKVDANFKKHYIQPCSMICCIGGTGSGKTNALIDFLNRKNNAFYDIIIFSGSTVEEPLYNLLKQKMPEIRLFNNIEELVPLSEFDNNDKDQEKLIVFDDFISLKPKEMKKINEYLTSGRKFGFTVWCMAQNYTSVGKLIVRNLNYIIMFKLNDNVSINNIIKNHNIHDIDKDRFKQCYVKATSEPRQFFMIDMKGPMSMHLRQNFLNNLL